MRVDARTEARRPAVDDMGHGDGFRWTAPAAEGGVEQLLQLFPGSTQYGRLGRLSYCQIHAPPHQVDHRRRTGKGHDPRWHKMLYQHRGDSELVQRGVRRALSCGSWVMYDPRESFHVTNFSAVDQLILLIPRDALPAPRTAGAAGAAGLIGSEQRDDAISRILLALLSAMFDELPLQSANRVELGESIIALTRAAMRQAEDVHQHLGAREVLRERIVAFINFNLSQPDLSAEKIARSLGCSIRHVHRVFADGDMTLNRYISSERLDRCRAELETPALSGRSITEIGLSWGFSSSAYFSSAFQKRFGCSPREIRRRLDKGARAPDR